MKISIRITSLITLLALALALQTQTANAEPENPIVRGNMDVSVIGGGKVTGTGIDCGTECSRSETWRDNEIPPKNRLTATANNGWGFAGWTECTPVLNQPTRCDASYGTEEPTHVVARFNDVMAPSVFISGVSPADEIGNEFWVGVGTHDNDRVTRVEYLIDGSVVATVNSAPWSAVINATGLDEGVHQLQARSYDPTGNNGITANWPITIDHTGPEVQLNSPVPATSEATPKFSFGSSSGDFADAYCAIKQKGSDLEPIWCARGEWFSADTPTEGEWQFVVLAEDRAGNQTVVTHDFVVDRTAPVATMTSGPVDGSVVEIGNVKFEWTVTDGLPVTQTCVWDNGEEIACNGSAARGLTAGAHSFKVVFADQAGNKNVLARTFSVKKAGDTPNPDPNPDPKPDPKPDPDATDRTAPVVKLVAPKQKLRNLGKALRLNVRCDEACSGRVVVTGRAGIKFTGRVAMTGAGVTKLRLKPSAVTRKRLALGLRSVSPKPLALTARAALKDKAGNTGKAGLKFRVKA